MGKPITVYIDDETEARLKLAAFELARTVEELAESSVSEGALDYFRGRLDDPADLLAS